VQCDEDGNDGDGGSVITAVAGGDDDIIIIISGVGKKALNVIGSGGVGFGIMLLPAVEGQRSPALCK